MRTRITPTTLAVAAALALAVASPAAYADRGRIAYGTFDPDGGDATSVVLVDAGGTHRTTLLRFGGEPRWSPDGRLLAVAGCAGSADDRCVTTIVRPDGRVVRTLSMPAALGDETSFGPSVWTPDGSRLTGGVDSSNASLDGIWTVRAGDGGGLRRVTHNAHGIDIPGGWSPSGRWLSLVRDVGDDTAKGIYLVHPDGSGLHRLTPRSLVANPEHGGRWSPDGRTLVFDARPDEDSRFALWTIRADGRHLQRIPVPLPCGGSVDDEASYGCFAPAWSPDGRSIVFGTLAAATGDRRLYTVRLDGTRLTRVTHGKAAPDVPDWS